MRGGRYLHDMQVQVAGASACEGGESRDVHGGLDVSRKFPRWPVYPPPALRLPGATCRDLKPATLATRISPAPAEPIISSFRPPRLGPVWDIYIHLVPDLGSICDGRGFYVGNTGQMRIRTVSRRMTPGVMGFLDILLVGIRAVYHRVSSSRGIFRPRAVHGRTVRNRRDDDGEDGFAAFVFLLAVNRWYEYIGRRVMF